MYYFGPWDKPEAPLQQFVDQRDDLYAGRKPRLESDGLDVRELLNRFLTSKLRQLEIGEITNRTFLDYKATCERIRRSSQWRTNTPESQRGCLASPISNE